MNALARFFSSSSASSPAQTPASTPVPQAPASATASSASAAGTTTASSSVNTPSVSKHAAVDEKGKSKWAKRKARSRKRPEMQSLFSIGAGEDTKPLSTPGKSGGQSAIQAPLPPGRTPAPSRRSPAKDDDDGDEEEQEDQAGPFRRPRRTRRFHASERSAARATRGGGGVGGYGERTNSGARDDGGGDRSDQKHEIFASHASTQFRRGKINWLEERLLRWDSKVSKAALKYHHLPYARVKEDGSNFDEVYHLYLPRLGSAVQSALMVTRQIPLMKSHSLLELMFGAVDITHKTAKDTPLSAAFASVVCDHKIADDMEERMKFHRSSKLDDLGTATAIRERSLGVLAASCGCSFGQEPLALPAESTTAAAPERWTDYFSMPSTPVTMTDKGLGY